MMSTLMWAGLTGALIARPLAMWIEARHRVVCLRIALRDTSPGERSEIIRAMQPPSA